jgi:alpha-L-rhamnosidase
VDAPASASFLPRLSAAPRPLLGWRAASQLAPGARANLTQSAYRVVVASSPALLPGSPDVFDSGVVASASSVAVPYGGPPLKARARVFWRVELFDGGGASCGFGAETGAWEVPPLTEADWASAAWLTRDAPHAPAPDCAYYDDAPAPLLRTEFALAQPAASVVRARLYAAGLGYFTPFLDGAQVGDEALAPGWTDFNATVLFSTFDVTSFFAGGSSGAPPATHVLGIALGNGWFKLAPLLFWGSKKFAAALPQGEPMARVLLAVDFADGSTQNVISSAATPPGAWRVGGSEVLFNSIYLGTRVDRRLEPVGWATAAFDASGWPLPHDASAAAAGLGALVSQSVPPVRRQAPLPVKLLSSSPGELTLDIGRQISGVCTFCFSAGGLAAGAKIDYRYGELLLKNGSVNGMTSVAGQIKNGNGGECAPKIAFAEDHYVARGDAGGECFTPTWTWHAARYIMVTGDAAALAALSVADTQCHPMRSNVAAISTFETSNPLLNDIHQIALNTFENNMVSIQSDCPHRERLGYTGDALMSGESLIANFDMATFYAKRLDDVLDAQRANGGITETAPFVGISDAGLGGGSGPIGWQTYFTTAAAWLLKYYGNRPAVERAFGAATRYVEFLDAAPRSAIENGLGDWMPIETPAVPLTGLGFQHISYLAYANLSLVVGNASQAAAYSARAAAIADALNAAFLDPATGVYATAGGFNATQCGQAMPLFLRIVPPASLDAAIAVLVANLAAHDGNLQVGSFGVKYLLMALIDAGRADLAFNVMTKTTFPSFGYMLNGTANGLTNATTLWECWCASDDTFSHDHPMFGSSEVYFFHGLAGIVPHPEAVALDRILIKPAPPGLALASVNASIETHRGLVSSSWRTFANGTFALTVCVPPNVRAEVWMPGAAGARFELGTCCGCVFTSHLVAAANDDSGAAGAKAAPAAFALAPAALAPAASPAALAPAPPPSDAFLIGCAHDDPACADIMRATPPPAFDVRIDTTRGSFTVHVNSSWAPPMAQRFFALARLQYFASSPFYRALRTNATHSFVTQWGYRGAPAVDQAWVARKTSMATARVRASNTRGTVAFGTSEVANNGNMPYCRNKLCSLGFSVELFINLGDNSRLDASDFSPFGFVAEEDMARVVDGLYADYGECADLCAAPAVGLNDSFCLPAPGGGWRGTNLTNLLLAGNDYLRRDFGALDYVTGVAVV